MKCAGGWPGLRRMVVMSDRLVGVRVRTARFKGGRTAVQLVDDEVADGLRVLTHDVEALAEVHILDDVVHHHRLGHQTHDGEQTGGGAVHCKREAHSRHIRCHQGRTDVHAGVLFQDHGDDIRAARGCADVEQERRTAKGDAKVGTTGKGIGPTYTDKSAVTVCV